MGYLHASFANGSGYVRMQDVPAEWDFINLAFGEPPVSLGPVPGVGYRGRPL